MGIYNGGNDILSLPHEELIETLANMCDIELPATVDTIEEVREAGKALSKLGPLYSYLVNMKMRANLMKRLYKKKKEDKENYENAIATEAILDAYVDQVKMLYNTASRLITVRQMVNDELKFLKGTI